MTGPASRPVLKRMENVTPDHDELDRIIERYQAKMPAWMARFVTWIRKQLTLPSGGRARRLSQTR